MSCQPVQGSKRPHHTYTKRLQNSIMPTRRKQKNTNLKWSKQSSVWEYVKLKKYGEPRYKIHDAVLKYNDSTSLLMYRVKSTHPSMRSGMQQSTIPAVLARRKSTWDEARMEGITQRICKMVAKDMLHSAYFSRKIEWGHRVMGTDRASLCSQQSAEHSLSKLSISLSTGHRFYVSRILCNKPLAMDPLPILNQSLQLA